ncbi:MAG: type II toxin-antitoxin system RelE/ParE family toxin [Candidatus Solibacter sp.]|nr:type II toxin-antitoxin system RelE/ParE family toxin [Candidatus Solibacter sp.]
MKSGSGVYRPQCRFTDWCGSRRLTSYACHTTLVSVIRSFRHRGLKRLWDGDPSRIGAAFRDRIENVLSVLDAATSPADLDLPGYRLHALKGDLRGSWSVSISGNWRIVFRVENGNVFEVDLTDYH